MKPPLYSQAFSHSLRLAWKQHTLWPLGLFAAALGQLGIVDALTQAWFTARGYQPGEGWMFLASLVRNGIHSGDVSAGPLLWSVFVGLALIGIGFLFVFVSVSSLGALVDSTAHSIRRKKLKDISHSWHTGTGHVWPIFFITVCKKAILLFVGFLTAAAALPVLLSAEGSSLLFLLTFVIASIIGVVVSILAIYAIGYIVIEEQSVMRSIVSAWRLFVEHWLVSLEVGMTMFFINILVIFFVLVGFFVSLIPAFISYFFALLFSSGTIFAFGVAISATLFLIMFLFICAVFSVFVTSTWVYLFMQMHKTGIKSHILHWLR